LTGKQIARRIEEEKGVRVGKSTVNAYLAQKTLTYKVAMQEDVARNSPVIIEERYLFAKQMLEENTRPDDPDRVVYWDISYFETNIVKRKARVPRGKPAVVPKGHRGLPEYDIEFTEHPAKVFEGGKANSLALLAAITGRRVLLARTQFRHPTAQDCIEFFKDVLLRG